MHVVTMSDSHLSLATTPSPRYLGMTTFAGPSILGLAIMFGFGIQKMAYGSDMVVRHRCLGKKY